MRSFLAGLRTLILPWGAPPGTPRIVLGSAIPASLSIANVTFGSAIIWYFNATEYYFIATGTWTAVPTKVVIKGTFDAVNGITVYEVNRPDFNEMAVGSTAFDSNHPDILFRDVAVNVESGASLAIASKRISSAWEITEPWAGPAAGGTTTSATFVTMPNAPTLTITKQGDASETVICGRMHASGFSTAVPTEVGYGVLIDGSTDQGVDLFRINTANQHAKMCATEFTVTGLAAGNHTFVARWLRNVAVGTLTFDDRDRACLTVEERPIP